MKKLICSLIFLAVIAIFSTSCISYRNTKETATLIGRAEKSWYKIIPEGTTPCRILTEKGDTATVLMNTGQFMGTKPGAKGRIELGGKLKYFFPAEPADFENMPVTVVAKTTGVSSMIVPGGCIKCNAVFPNGEFSTVSVNLKDFNKNRLPFSGYVNIPSIIFAGNISFHKEKILMHL